MAKLRVFAFAIRAALVWILMVAILVVVPDILDDWMPLDVARVTGWVLASGMWVAVIEREWRERFSPAPRFLLQIVLWLSAALLAIWIADTVHRGEGILGRWF